MHEAQSIPSRIRSPKTTLRHIMFKLQKTKDKEKILTEAKGKTNTSIVERKRLE